MSKPDVQIKNVSALYDEGASLYDKLSVDSLYVGESLLVDTFAKHKIKDGKIFDVGCGTGKIKESLGDNFKYEGVDISYCMVEKAKKRGYIGHVGAIEDVVKGLPDKSVDHVIALSSMYFMKDFTTLLSEFERIARKSFFITLEQFDPGIKEMMEGRGIHLYNHQSSLIKNPTEIQKDIFLWRRVSTGDDIRGDVVFKKIK
jgi:ubiquinone/menaquinone biosynthesis C-methylase UbiE